MTSLELERRDQTDSGMPAARVVPAFDELEHSHPRLSLGRETPARESIKRYVEFYNARRPHSSIEDRTPDEAYFGLQAMKAAA